MLDCLLKPQLGISLFSDVGTLLSADQDNVELDRFLAWDLGAATDISDLTGWQLTSDKPEPTASLFVVDTGREISGALRADHTNFWLALRIGIANKNVARKQIHN